MITLSKKLREARNEQNNNKKFDSCDSLRRRPMIRDTLLIKGILSFVFFIHQQFIHFDFILKKSKI